MLALLRLLTLHQSGVEIRAGGVVAVSGRVRPSHRDDLEDAARIHRVDHARVLFTAGGRAARVVVLGGPPGFAQVVRNVLALPR